MGDALRRINNLKGKNLILSVKHLSVQFAIYFTFLASGVFFIWLFENPPHNDLTIFYIYLVETLITTAAQLALLYMIYHICK